MQETLQLVSWMQSCREKIIHSWKVSFDFHCVHGLDIVNLWMVNQHGLNRASKFHCLWSRFLLWWNHLEAVAAVSCFGGSRLKPKLIANSNLGKFVVLHSHPLWSKSKFACYISPPWLAILFDLMQLDHIFNLGNHSAIKEDTMARLSLISTSGEQRSQKALCLAKRITELWWYSNSRVKIRNDH